MGRFSEFGCASCAVVMTHMCCLQSVNTCNYYTIMYSAGIVFFFTEVEAARLECQVGTDIDLDKIYCRK
jgi:hypothetical protein